LDVGTGRTKPYQDESPKLHVRDRFIHLLPFRPYCSNDPQGGVRIRGRETALRYSHLQFNDRRTLRWLVFDIDRKDGAFAWEEAHLPAPNIVAGNPSNGHAHLFWVLARPVHTNSDASVAPMNFVSDVERGLLCRLRADPSYRGPLAKNPFWRQWRVQWPAPFPYLLSQLDCHLSQEDKRGGSQVAHVTGLGRNCTLFDELRAAAYPFARDFDRALGKLQFQQAILRKAHNLNLNFAESPAGLLSLSEVRSIANSVARFCWREFTPQKFSEIQRHRAEARTRRNLKIIEDIKNGRA
jgi:hypothetical protein